MILKNTPYIICESYPEYSETKLTNGTLNGKSIAEVVLQRANAKNRNGRFYSDEELFGQLTAPRTLELLHSGTLKAESGHPMSKDLQRQATIVDSNCCARFLKLWTDGDLVMAHVVATNNDLGKSFDLDLKEGIKPAWSLRALGSIEQTRRGAEVKNLRLITWDSVIYPSHPEAYTQKLLSESALPIHATDEELEEAGIVPGIGSTLVTMESLIMPIDRQDVINYIQQESASLKFLRECFDFVYSDIQVTGNGTKVILSEKKSGDTIVVPIETHIHNELMNYAAKKLGHDD
ncbi:MAG: hypothetical protein IKR19_08755 [Acholeplasmatales bacterium]|nr:hypothetical protein [Acholeplasmatales bacterium]